MQKIDADNTAYLKKLVAEVGAMYLDFYKQQCGASEIRFAEDDEPGAEGKQATAPRGSSCTWGTRSAAP